MDNYSKITTKQVVKEMFEQRGYIINFEKSTYDKEIKEEEDDILVATKQNDEEVYAFFTDIEKFNTEYVQYYTRKINSLGIKHCLIVYIDTITSSALKLINNISINKPEINLNCKIEILDFEIFTYKELSFNITKHELQPKNFELLSPIESQKFKKKWGIKMAKMFVTDPICKFYHFSPGSIIKITRKNNYVTHRIVKKNLKK